VSDEPRTDEVTTLPAARLKTDKKELSELISKRAAQPNLVALRQRVKPGLQEGSGPDMHFDADALENDKLFPVKMLKEYRPATMRFQFGEMDEETGVITYTDPPEVLPGQDAGFLHRIEAGEYALIPRSEAIQLFKRGIAERNDELAA